MSDKIKVIEAIGKLSLGAIIAIILGITLYFGHIEKVAENQMRSEEIKIQAKHNETFEETMERQVDALEEFLNYYTGRIRNDD